MVTTLYRPPNSQIEFFEKFECLITNLDEESKEFILVRDFNCDLFASDRLNNTNRLLEIANLFQLMIKHLITQATRVTKKPENIINSGVVHLEVIDHSLIFGCRKISICKNPPKIVEARNYKCYNTLEFNQDSSIALSNCDWATDDLNVIFQREDTMMRWLILADILRSAI